MAINLADARAIVRISIGHGLDPGGNFDLDNLDRAIQWAGNDWCEFTRSVIGSTDVSVAMSATTIDPTATAGLDELAPHNVIRAHIAGAEVEEAPLYSIHRWSSGIGLSGQPDKYAFEGSEKMWLYPIPDAAYTLTLFWWQPFTTFTAGISEASAAAVDLNIPQRYLHTVLQLAAAHKAVFTNPDLLYSQAGMQQYMMIRDQVAAEYARRYFPEAQDKNELPMQSAQGA